MKDVPKPDRRLKYDAAFRAEALCLAEQSRRGECYDNALPWYGPSRKPLVPA